MVSQYKPRRRWTMGEDPYERVVGNVARFRAEFPGITLGAIRRKIRATDRKVFDELYPKLS